MPLCFDLDGTLGHFSSGFVLLREALGSLWEGGAPTPEELACCQGSTDWEIVDELHRGRFGTNLSESNYMAYERVCVARFREAFRPGGLRPSAHAGILEGMHRLAGSHAVALVSGNAPALLDFKAEALGVASSIPRVGSLPRHGRADLLRRALEGGSGPHLYIGDRPHDLAAAKTAGVPFLAIGDAVPGNHPSVPAGADADLLVRSVEGLLRKGR
jgi:phosphoglycolate phosphatase-like HAD superfamily hydrolase